MRLLLICSFSEHLKPGKSITLEVVAVVALRKPGQKWPSAGSETHSSDRKAWSGRFRKSCQAGPTPILRSVRTRQNFQARALGAFHGRVSSTARAWGHKFSSEAMHVYMGENRFSLWSYHIGTVFKSIQPSFDIYWVSNHHLVLDIHQMIGGLHNLYKFQWAITSCLSYMEYCPENIKTCLSPCGG